MAADSPKAAVDQTPVPLTPDEQRGSGRQRVLLAGRLVYGEDDLTLECAIRDLSEKGARVRLSSPAALPSRVWLIEVRSGVAYLGDVAWRRVPEIGLKFVGRRDLRAETSPEFRVLKRVWVESAAR